MTKPKDPNEVERLSFCDTFNSMTGYEEEAVEAAFGAEAGDLTKKTFNGGLSLVALRAMVFVVARRAEVPDPYAEAMGLTRIQLNERFLNELEDAEDAIPEEPDTELGKGDSQPE